MSGPEFLSFIRRNLNRQNDPPNPQDVHRNRATPSMNHYLGLVGWSGYHRLLCWTYFTP